MTLQNIQKKNNRKQQLIQWKKARAEYKSPAKKNKKEDWEKLPALSTAKSLKIKHETE